MIRCLSAGAILALAVCWGFADSVRRGTATGEADPHIALIRKVGKEGAGNPEASAAWKSLVRVGPSALVPILKGMSEGEPVALNWLQTAFEAIAEKAQATGTLSKSDLEAVVKDTTNANSARSLAYDWLVKVDPKAPDRILPGMLKDPAPQLRRTAVARLMKQAEADLGKKNESDAKQKYQDALASACDPEQVEQIARALDKLGIKIDVARQLGMVRSWQLIAPFEHTKNSGWNVAYPPEKNIDFTATYKGKDGKEAKWVPYTTTDAQGKVDLTKPLGSLKGTVAYACATIESPEERAIEIRAGCINGLKVFLNGKEIFACEEYHHGTQVDQYAARGQLQKGKNVLLLKVCQNEQKEQWAQRWMFQARICDLVGAGVPFTNTTPGKKED